MKRNFEKSVQEGRAIMKRHKMADLRLSEIDTIYDIAKKDSMFKAITTAFDFGVSVGSRMEKQSR